jgi:hypothetical protein
MNRQLAAKSTLPTNEPSHRPVVACMRGHGAPREAPSAPTEQHPPLAHRVTARPHLASEAISMATVPSRPYHPTLVCIPTCTSPTDARKSTRAFRKCRPSHPSTFLRWPMLVSCPHHLGYYCFVLYPFGTFVESQRSLFLHKRP